MKKLLLAGILLTSYLAQAQQWVSRNPMPTGRASSATAVLGDTIYVIGGSVGNGESTVVEAYIVSTDSWITVASLNQERSEFVAEVINGKIYVAGGYTNAMQATNTVEEYNPQTNMWTLKAAMPTARSWCSGGVVNNRLYVVGGWPGNFNNMEEYDPSTNSWTIKSPAPIGLQNYNGAAVISDTIYVVGGKDSWTTVLASVMKYSPQSNTWSMGTPLQTPTFAGSVSEYMGDIYYLGGCHQPPNYVPNVNTCHSFNIATNTWVSELPFVYNRAAFSSATFNNRLFIFGGLDSTGVVFSSVEELSNCNLLVSSNVTQTGALLTADQVGATYQWLDCDNNYAIINGETNQSYTPAVTGNYAVEVNMNGCVDTSACFLVDYTGIEELLQSEKELVKIVDFMGRETEYKPNTPLIFIYSDGTRERVMKIEE